MDKGLIIEGRHITGTAADFDDVLMPILEQVSCAHDAGEGAEGGDELALQIVTAMIGDTLLHDWQDANALLENITLRSAVIDVMRNIASGLADCDYASPANGVDPVLGQCNNEVWFDRRAKGKSNEQRERLGTEMNRYWHELGTNSLVFAASDAPIAKCVQHTQPFRGECQGALQLALMRGAKRVMGDDGLNALHRQIKVPAFVGTSHVPPQLLPPSSRKSVKTFANRFLEYQTLEGAHPIEAQRPIPGDYFYYKNIDSYLAFSLGRGGWQGENAICMGYDFNGHPHFSGMGLSYYREFQLHMELQNAVYHDCNLPFIHRWRAERPDLALSWPFILVQRPEDLRFTLRGVLRVPKDEAQDSVPLLAIKETPPAKAPDNMDHRLEKLGAKRDANGRWQHAAVTFETLADAFGIIPGHLSEPPSGPMHNPSYVVNLGDWLMVLHPHDGTINPTHRYAVHAVECISSFEGTSSLT